MKFRRGVIDHASAVHASVGGKVLRNFRAVDGLQLVRIPSSSTLQAAVSAYRASPEVEYAEPNYTVKLLGTPNDPLVPQQWALSNPGGAHAKAGADIQAFNAWNVTTGSSTVVVAVTDTGIDYTHPDLAANIFTNSADCNNNGVDDDGDGYVDDCHGINTYDHTSNTMDDYGHGTHVAGIIGAIGNNAVGVSGVNWNVQILPCKFLDYRGYGTVAGAIECLSYVKMLKDRGVNIVATNNSWGGFDYSDALNDAIKAQRDDGILFIAAAGNEFSDNDFMATYPANVPYSNVISVASSTDLDQLSDFSNWGEHSVHLSAPGDDILSTLPSNSYGFASGTSMAAPYVTGVVALLKAQDPSRDWRQLKNLVLSGGDVVPELSKTITGRRLNAYGSLTCNSGAVYSRLKPSMSPASVTVGSPLTISYMNVNCGTPATQLQATVVETGESILLKDDGVAPDDLSNDGVLSANWTPTANGIYTISVQGGDSITVEVLTPYVYVAKVPEYRTFTGTSLDLGDDDVATVDAPFPINFGNAQYSKLYISSNGTISLSTPFKEYFNRWIPLSVSSAGFNRYWSAYQTTTLIAPWWDDLYPVKGTSQNVFWQVTGTAPARELVVEWRDVRIFDCHGDPASTVSFEVVFKEGSNDISFEYGKTALPNCAWHDHGLSATIGLETSGNNGAQWSYNSSFIRDGNSLQFLLTTESIPTNPVPTITDLVPNHTAQGSGSMTLVVQGSNFVPGSLVLWNGAARSTVYVSPTEIHAAITSFDLVVSNLIQVSVQNPAPGGGTSNQLPFGVGGEPPYITSLTPSSVPAGSADFDLTIRGSGFVNGQGFIVFGGTPRQITSLTSTEIHAKILAYDVAKAGTYKVYAYGYGGFASNQVDFVVTAASATSVYNDGHGSRSDYRRALPMKFLGWSSPHSGASDYVKWFTRDRVQSAAANSAPPAAPVPLGSTLTAGTTLPGIHLNTSIPAGYIPTGIVAADFNHDGNMDWAVSNGGDNNIYIYFGRGDGTCDPAVILPLRGFSPVAMVGADLRKNGNTDLIVAEIDSNTVGVFLNKGDGTFEPELLHYTQGPVYSVNVGDFNGDGIPDIIYGVDTFEATTYTQTLGYSPGLGNGNFGPPVLQPPVSGAAGLAYRETVADLKNSGHSDVISSDIYLGTFVYENRDGVLKTGQQLGAVFMDYVEYNSAVGDIDEDGCPDVVIVNDYASAKVLFGHCDGTFEVRSKQNQWGLGEVPFAVKLADVNGDGHLDIITGGILIGGGVGYGGANGGLVSVMLGDGKGGFGRPRVYPAEQGIYDLAVVDINHDGKPDIITANQDSDSVSILINDGNGGFGPNKGQYVGYIWDGNGGGINDPLGSPLTFDINGDGKPDILLLEDQQYGTSSYSLAAMLNQGNGTFSDPIRTDFIGSDYAYPMDYAVADFRKSGKLDVLVSLNTLSETGTYAFAANQGNGTFKAFPQTAMPSSYARLAVGDFDGDGIIDAVALGLPHTITFLHSNGDGTFTQKPGGTVLDTTAYMLGNVIAADVNHDGKLDIVAHLINNVVPYNDHAVVLYLGNGDGTFQAGQIVVPNVSKVTYADLNHDGRIDILSASDSWSSTQVGQVPPQYRTYLGQSNSTFSLSSTYDQYTDGLANNYDPFAGGKFESFYADYDGDHVNDIAALQWTTASPRRNYVQFMKGMSDGTFVPTYQKYFLGTNGTGAPYWAADFDGDGIVDMLEYDGFTASFHILKGTPGRNIDATLLANPVKGNRGTVRVIVGAASNSATQVSLAASDPNISISPSASVPAGATYVDVPFTIGPAFNMNRQFKITATSGSESANAWGTQVPADSPVGFTISTYDTSTSGVPGGDTYSEMTLIYSRYGYSGHVVLSCANLPQGATCFFNNPEIDIQKGGSVMTYTTVRLASNVPPGTYNFQVQATDGVSTATTPITLTVSDFSLVAQKTYIEVLPNGTGTVPFGVIVNGPYDSINYTCAVKNGGGTCSVSAVPGGMQLSVKANNVALGTYGLTITATSGNLTHTLDFSLRVVDITATFSSTTVNMRPGNQAQVTVHLTAPQGMKDTMTLSCSDSTTMNCDGIYPIEFASGATSADATVYLLVPSTYFQAKANAGTSTLASRREIRPHWFATLALLPIGILLLHRKKGTASVRLITLSVLLAITLSLSCGGGGGGTGGGTGGGGNGGGGGTGVSKTETFTISVVHPNFTKNIGTIKVNISK